MAILALVSYKDKIIQRKIINKITEEEKKIAMSIFNEYKRKGVILNEFSDITWETTNETQTIRLDFSVDEVFIKKHISTSTPREFVNILKYYICFCMGKHSLEIIQKNLRLIKRAMRETNCFLVMPQRTEILENTGVSDFINIFPYANEELIIECIDSDSPKIRRRLMAEYQSYFLFDKILDKFWKEASDCEKDLYYPIYLWWKISMVIPIRPTEFSVIPKDCIPKIKNKWMLRIRRTQLKGEMEKVHAYKLDEDYKVYKYAVTDEIASMIQDYKTRATKYDEAEIDSLFSDDMFVSLLDTRNLIRTKHLNYNHMALLLDYFYINVIMEKYGYSVLFKEDMMMVDKTGELKQLKENEIVRIALGDSRHIAMQNMIINGCNILMAKEITGHHSANMIYHYAGNIPNLIKCRAYSLFKLSKQKVVAISQVTKTNVSTLLIKPEAKYEKVDGGLCYSAPFVLYQDCRDCFAVQGNCENCKYFKSENGSRFIRKEQERIVEEKIERLLGWLDSARVDKNKDEFRVMANQLEANIENLQNGYIQDLNEGVKI